MKSSDSMGWGQNANGSIRLLCQTERTTLPYPLHRRLDPPTSASCYCPPPPPAPSLALGTSSPGQLEGSGDCAVRSDEDVFRPWMEETRSSERQQIELFKLNCSVTITKHTASKYQLITKCQNICFTRDGVVK